jgi:hypothetical protein
MVPFDNIALPLASVLASALLVERIIEGGKNVIDMLPKAVPNTALLPAEEAEQPLRELVDRHAQAEQRDQAESDAEDAARDIAKLKDQIAGLEGSTNDPAVAARLNALTEKLNGLVNQQARTAEWDEKVPISKVLVAPATDPDDGATARVLVLQLFAAATGIVVAHYAKLRLFTPLLAAGNFPVELDYLLTGLLVGGGSAPVHLLIRFISERRCPVEIEEAAAQPETEMEPLPAVEVMAPLAEPAVTDRETWVEIPYEGGIDRDILEGIHHRGQEPTLIVYHHTAMKNTATMEDLVRVIKERTDAHGNHWITGYHCVILGDATIAPFCRWDRYGNHAAGYNRQSLGVTFMGNFETDPRVPFSNPDGRYGPSRPPEAQLVNGARVVALWTLLYGIPLDFEKSIIPHRQIAKKTCPGGNFPYTAFKDLVRDFHTRWKGDPATLERIRQFALKPYLFDDPQQSALRRAS